MLGFVWLGWLDSDCLILHLKAFDSVYVPTLLEICLSDLIRSEIDIDID